VVVHKEESAQELKGQSAADSAFSGSAGAGSCRIQFFGEMTENERLQEPGRRIVNRHGRIDAVASFTGVSFARSSRPLR
jgi:hypothetical protein